MPFTTRPTVRSFGGAVSAGHYLATEIGARMLADGGNAADAACAMGLALQVLEPHMNGPAGEVPILFKPAGEERVHAISGQGVAPAALTREHFAAQGLDRIPGDGLQAATVPAALDAWCLLLERYGTRSFADVSAGARGLAERGFPMYPFLRSVLGFLAPRFEREWPGSAALYLPLPGVGARQRNPAWANVLAELAQAEHGAHSREAGIRAARDAFYRGRPAEIIERFCAEERFRDASGHEHGGLLTADDLARYAGRVEEPVALDYRGARVWKCGPWTQGPVFLQQLRLLEGFDLGAMDHNGPDHLHTWIECAKLAFADREACYADPLHARVPLLELLSDAYTEQRRTLIDPERASYELRPGLGKLPAGWPWVADEDQPPAEPQAWAAARGRGDTTHLDAVDAEGNLVSATPSGAWVASSPVIPELGIPLGTRAQMFVLDPDHPNCAAPGKRPRTTLTPSMARLPDGRFMAFGTPGGDQQDQWTLQAFLNVVDFGMRDLQHAIDAPTVHSFHAPDSFYPRTAKPGLVAAEERIEPAVLEELGRRGHVVRSSGPWEHGRVLAAARHPDTGLCEAAASPRSVVAYAVAVS